MLGRGREAVVKMLAQMPPLSKGAIPFAGRDENRAFLIYALALAGDKAGARAARQKLDLKNLATSGLAYAILTDKLLGGSSQAALAQLNRLAVSADGMIRWSYGDGFNADWNDQASTAIALRAILAANADDPRVPRVLRWLMLQRTGDYWGSTRDTSWVMAAFCDYLAAHPEATGGSGEAHILLNGKPFKTIALTPDVLQEREIVLRVPPSALQPGKNEVRFERTGGSSPIYYAVEMRQTLPVEDVPALSSSGIGIQREYLRLVSRKAGQASWSLQTEPTGNRLRTEDRLRVRLTLMVPRTMAYVLIEDPFPAGCEVTERGGASETVEWGYWYSSVDVRDDKIAFFARTLQKGKYVIEYNVRAQTPGVYHTLPTLLQGMYAPEMRGESAEARVEVR
jgi:hypothetical protein